MAISKFCYILDTYYNDNPSLIKILDIDDETKHNIRTHMCLNIFYNGNHILIPLRKNLGSADRPFGKIGFSVPSKTKAQAGLDYRYIMIINDAKYLRFDTPRIPKKQMTTIETNYSQIEKEALEYITSYIKVAKKGRVDKTARFRESSLVNFHKELHIYSEEEKNEMKTTVKLEYDNKVLEINSDADQLISNHKETIEKLNDEIIKFQKLISDIDSKRKDDLDNAKKEYDKEIERINNL